MGEHFLHKNDSPTVAGETYESQRKTFARNGLGKTSI
jgi:hypothetical protein